MAKQCELYDRLCVDCGECDICDMDPNKKCSNCGDCIDEVNEFRTLNVDEFVHIQEDKKRRKK